MPQRAEKEQANKQAGAAKKKKKKKEKNGQHRHNLHSERGGDSQVRETTRKPQ